MFFFSEKIIEIGFFVELFLFIVLFNQVVVEKIYFVEYRLVLVYNMEDVLIEIFIFG